MSAETREPIVNIIRNATRTLAAFAVLLLIPAAAPRAYAQGGTLVAWGNSLFGYEGGFPYQVSNPSCGGRPVSDMAFR